MGYNAPVEQPSYIEPQAPPSTYAIAAAIEGHPGGWPRMVGLTLWRAVVLLPGLWVGGVRGWTLPTAALGGSTAITAYLYFYYKTAKEKQRA